MKTQKQIAEFLKHHLETVKKNNLTVDMSATVKQFDTINHCGTVCCMAGWLPYTYPKKFKWVQDILGGYSVRSEVGERLDVLKGIAGIPEKLTSYLFGLELLQIYPGYPDIGLDTSFEKVVVAWEQVIADLEQEKFPL